MGITVEFSDDGCALMTMRNGENRFTLDSLKQINDALDKVERNPECRVLITTGEGKFYCNGIDLDWLIRHGGFHNNDVALEFGRQNVEMYWRFMHFPIPTVAAINGHAVAGGAFMAICHDYRVMRSDRGWFFWNETLLDLKIRKSLQEVLWSKLSSQALRESVIYSKKITGPQALNLGLVDAVTNQSKLVSVSRRIGLEALGGNKVSRSNLQDMKRDLIPRRVKEARL